MAKDDMQSNVADALEAITKKYGKGSIMLMSERPQEKVKVIPTGSILLDQALGVWGIPRGRIIETFGAESIGKSSANLILVAQAQKIFKEEGKQIAYIDVEHSIDPLWAQRLGVDWGALYFSQPDSAEEALDILFKVTSSGGFGLVVLDSVAALATAAELQGEVGDAHIAQVARLMSQSLKKLAAIADNTETTLMFINQNRMNINAGGYGGGPSEVQPGGKALKYFSSIRLDLKRGEPIKKGEEQIGHKIKFKVAKNKLSAPFKVAEVSFYYDRGFDNVADMVDLAIEINVVTRSGAWFYYKGEQVSQGKENLVGILKENKEMYASIDKTIKEHFGIIPPDENSKKEEVTEAEVKQEEEEHTKKTRKKKE